MDELDEQYSILFCLLIYQDGSITIKDLDKNDWVYPETLREAFCYLDKRIDEKRMDDLREHLCAKTGGEICEQNQAVGT